MAFATVYAIALMVSCSTAVATSGRSPMGLLGPYSLLIVALPQASWAELRSADLGEIHAVMDGGAVALMPVASPTDADPNRPWVTLGAGRAAVGGPITGKLLLGGGMQVDVGPLNAANQRAHTSATPGLLGSQLREVGFSTALIAYHASRRPQLPPSGAAIMDRRGGIAGGGLYYPAAMTPLGKRLDPRQVRSAVEDELQRRRVVLLDLTGSASLEEVDVVIGQVAEVVQKHRGRLALLTALAPAYRDQGRRRTMGFIVTRSFDWDRRAGLLTSTSTRWPGMVTGSDFAPTVLYPFRGYLATRKDAAAMTGRAMWTTQVGDPLVYLDRLDCMLTDQFILEGKAARLYVSYMMLLAAATFAVGAWRAKPTRWLALPALIGLALPIGLLLCPLAGVGQTKQLATGVLASLALGASAFRLGTAARALGIAALVGGALIVADVLLGSPLMRFAPLGFGAVTGARFYGIGNEYTGVLGAMAPIGLGLMLQQVPRTGWLAVVLGVGTVLLVGAPWWGANWGGCVSVAAGLIAMWVALAPQRRWRRAAMGVIALLAAAVLPAALDLLQPEAARSHIGVAAAALVGGQLDAIRDTAIRKIEMNWRLAQLASWWWLLAPVGFLGIWELARRSKETWRRAQVAASVRAGFLGALITGLVGVVVNDSGVVILGMALAVTFAAYVFLLSRSEASVA
jgi:hypothetical protein